MILDRIEGEVAVLELDDGGRLHLPTALLPAGVKEGDVLRLSIDTDATRERGRVMQERMNRLFQD